MKRWRGARGGPSISSCVVQGPEGALYLLTDDTNGKLLKVTPR
ncbi:hypothetical protein [Archangium sp.]|nr:hypothetical protein [Archangium sp.]